MNSRPNRQNKTSLLPGTAVGMNRSDIALRVFTPGIQTDQLQLVLRQIEGDQNYLCDTGWSSEPFWLEPAVVRREGDLVILGISNKIADRIASETMIAFGISEDRATFSVKGALAWRVDGEIQEDDPIHGQSGTTLPVPQHVREKYSRHFTATIPKATTVDPFPEDSSNLQGPVNEKRRSVKRNRPFKKLFLGLGVACLLTASTLAYLVYKDINKPALMDYPKSGNAPMETLRALLSQNSFDEGQIAQIIDNWIDEGAGEAAYLLARVSAQNGNGAAALRMGLFSDPLTFDQSLSTLGQADAESAACWYALSTTSAPLPEPSAQLEPNFIGVIAARFEKPSLPESNPFGLDKMVPHQQLAEKRFQDLSQSLKSSNHPSATAVENIRSDSSKCIY